MADVVVDIGQVDFATAEPVDLAVELNALTDGAFDAFDLTEHNGSALDPSGFVKGWAIERVADNLEAAGAGNFCINAGGDIVLRGARRRIEPGEWGSAIPTSRTARPRPSVSIRAEDGVGVLQPADGFVEGLAERERFADVEGDRHAP